MIDDLIRRDDAPEPCPFCRANVKCYWGSDDYTDGDTYQIICASCGVQGKECTTKADAIAAWNTRAVDPAAIREAALREAAEVRISHSKGYEFIPTRFRDAIIALIGEPK